MAKGVVSRGAIPGRHGEHEVGSRAQVGDATILRIVNDKSGEVGTVLLSEGVDDVPVGGAPQVTKGSSKGIGGGFGVRNVGNVGRVGQMELSGDTGLLVSNIGFRDGEVLCSIVDV